MWSRCKVIRKQRDCKIYTDFFADRRDKTGCKLAFPPLYADKEAGRMWGVRLPGTQAWKTT